MIEMIEAPPLRSAFPMIGATPAVRFFEARRKKGAADVLVHVRVTGQRIDGDVIEAALRDFTAGLSLLVGR